MQLLAQIVAILACLQLAACGAPTDRGPVVLAASSLQDALGDAADAWEAQGHARPVLSFAATSVLARQIEQGAPADIFISADREWIDYLGERDLLRPGSEALFAGNRLVLVAPAKRRAPSPAADPGGLLRGARLAMADPDGVPAGRYGRTALESAGLWAELRGNIARTDNVRGALALAERGEVDFSIVYASDAAASDKVAVVHVFPASSHPRIVYPLAVLSASSHPDTQAFRSFLLSPQVRAILARRGFRHP